MRPLKDADKNGWAVTDFSVMMVAVDLRPLQIRRTDWLSDQLPQHLIHHYQPSDVRPTLFCDEFRFQMCSNNHRRRVWRHQGLRVDPAFTIARHKSPQLGVMVWGDISFDSWTP
ncbi:uncharacterized protein TNCV_3735841 [Trichonephila clavipes]|nr:uncharacterized protein TNCV_3735841 [Trichonephila clavipes]